MKIPADLQAKWDVLRSEGDPIAIAESIGCHAETVRRSLRIGEASDEVFEAIASFYDEKLEMLKKYI